MSFFRKITNLFRSYSDKEKKLIEAVKMITGDKPVNVSLYSLAMKHSSMAAVADNGEKECNERLEYLGDAILGAIIADFLFKKYPYKSEGFLTEIRSRIVSRESLNRIALKLGLDQLIDYDMRRKSPLSHKSLYGDAMEAFVGALYLDRGYAYCQSFIIKKLLLTHLDIDDIIANDTNYKSKLIEWSQKNNKDVKFEVNKDDHPGNQFMAQVIVDNDLVSEGMGYSKKKAEQDAARRACDVLEIA